MQGTLVKYLYINAISISILINTLTGGKAHQTFSARNWQNRRDGKLNLVWLIDFLVRRDRDHCLQCWVRWKLGDNYEKGLYYERHGQGNTDRL
jgi:hypothetical protein